MKLSHAIRLSLEASGAQAPSEFRMFRAGANETLKGVFLFTEASAVSVLAAARDWGVRLSIDYDHAMLNPYPMDPSASGKSAGSFVLAVRDGELWATDVKWTPAAKTAIEAREWLYVSPAFHHNEDGTITDIVNVALTNIPATKGIDPLIALSRAAGARQPEQPTKERPAMLKSLLTALSLPETATEADIVTALAAARAPLAELLAITGKATASEALGVVRAGAEALKSLPALTAELSRFKTEALSAAVEDAVKSFKLAPSLREWAMKLGATDRAQLDAFLAASVPVVPADATNGGAKQGATGGAVTALTAEEKAVCIQLGVTEDAFIKARKATAPAA